MANSFYGNVIYIDAPGIVSTKGIYVTAIQYFPYAVTNTVVLNWWDEANPTAGSHIFMKATAATGVITDDDTAHDALTAAAFPDTSVVKVRGGNGLVANHTYHLIETAGNDDHFHVTPTASWTDETSAKYEIISYPARTAFMALGQTVANTMESKFHYFGGHYFPNLICETLSASSICMVYVQ